MNSLNEVHDPATQELGEVEYRIRYIINKLYDCCFIGPIVVIPLKPYGYQIKLGLPSIERPFSLAAELPDNVFFEWITEQLRIASLHTVKHYALQLHHVDFFPFGGRPNVFKINMPRLMGGVNARSVAQTIPLYMNPGNHPKSPAPIIIHNGGKPTDGTVNKSDWYGTEEEYSRLTSINPNINYYIYEEVSECGE